MYQDYLIKVASTAMMRAGMKLYGTGAAKNKSVIRNMTKAMRDPNKRDLTRLSYLEYTNPKGGVRDHMDTNTLRALRKKVQERPQYEAGRYLKKKYKTRGFGAADSKIKADRALRNGLFESFRMDV